MIAIDDCGSGKSTLVNNLQLLGEESTQEQASFILSTFQSMFQGVSVTVHETSGVENSDAEGDTEFNKDIRSFSRGAKYRRDYLLPQSEWDKNARRPL